MTERQPHESSMLFQPILCCPRCKLTRKGGKLSTEQCVGCGLILQVTASSAVYNYTMLLRVAFPRRYRLYRALSNNGIISYLELAGGSLSLPDRKDVAEFGSFLGQFAESDDRVLDIGCGPLRMPGYLLDLQLAGAKLIGLDVNPTEFEGFRIVGCAEFLPLPDASVDIVVFATSLDHVCDLTATLGEVRRVLSDGGHCCIWMSDRDGARSTFRPIDKNVSIVRSACDLAQSLVSAIRSRVRHILAQIRLFVRGRYVEFDNGSVFYCPPGAVDPFHSFFESADQVSALAAKNNLLLIATKRGSNGVFLTFCKASNV